MNDILVSAVSMGILGTVFGFGLVWASQRFKVESDPRIDEIADAAPVLIAVPVVLPGVEPMLRRWLKEGQRLTHVLWVAVLLWRRLLLC